MFWPAYACAKDTESARDRRNAMVAELTKREARMVLAAVLRDDKIEPTPCQFDAQWLRDPVAANIAQTYLGSSVFADVIASHLDVGPGDLIDLNDAMAGRFCPEKEADALWRQWADDFRSGALLGEPNLHEGKPISPPRLRLRRIKITMPVFDRAFTTAAVVVSTFERMLWRTDAKAAQQLPQVFDERGYRRRAEIMAAGYTYVYRKRGEQWKRIRETQDWMAH